MKFEALVTLDEKETLHIRCEGECIRIGRDPSCECTIPETHARGVSWLHSKVEVIAGECCYTDLGSSFGSYLNGTADRLVHPARISVGDNVQLGMNESGLVGPVLRILSCVVENGVRESNRPPVEISQRLHMQMMIVALCVVLVIAGIILWRATRQPNEVAFATHSHAVPTEQHHPSHTAASKKSPETQPHSAKTSEPTLSNNMQSHVENKGNTQITSSPVKEMVDWDYAQNPIGTYVAATNTIPSILLQRKREGYPWTPLRANIDQVVTNTTLMSMPGSYSIIQMVSGIEVHLWGSLPAFSRFPALHESVVQFQNSQSPSMADISLVRGRIRLVNTLKAGMAKVNVLFQDEKWTVTLHSPRSEAVVELWHLSTPSRLGSEEPASLPVVGVFTRNQVSITTMYQQITLDGSSQVTWIGGGKLRMEPEVKKLTAPPVWMEQGIANNSQQVEQFKPALLDWATLLNRYENEVADMVRTCLNEKHEPAIQEVGIYFLAALDQPAKLVEYLRNDNPVIRGVAADSLRGWLLRNRLNLRILEKCLDDASYASDKKSKIIKLLGRFSDEEMKSSMTYQELIRLLEHEDSEIRQLSLWHLAFFFPKENMEAGFNPKGSPEDRKKSVAIWKNLVPPTKVPFK